MKKFSPAKIVSNREITKNHFLLQLEVPWLSPLIKPGHFVAIQIDETTTNPLLKIPLAIHDIHNHGISVLYRLVGQKSSLLSTKQPEEKVKLLGPLGNGFTPSSNPGDSILVAGGCGIAPLFLLAKELKKRGKNITFFMGATTKDNLLCHRELKTLGVNVFIATDDGSAGEKALVTDVLQHQLTKIQNPQEGTLYGSGPTPMLYKLAELARQFNLTGQLSFEAYMACGIGVCLGCSIPTKNGYKLCCKDGPVFNIEDFMR